MQHFYLIRHAEPESDGRSRYIGQIDLPLSKRGILQAEELKRCFKNIQIDQVYSSDLIRCKKTADILTEDRELTVNLCSNMREINMGDWDGVLIDEIRKNYPQAYEERGKNILTYKAPNGESFKQCAERSLEVWKSVLKQARDNGIKNTVLLSHSGWIRTLLCQLEKVPLDKLFQYDLDYVSTNHIIVDDDKVSIIATPGSI